MGGTKSRGQKHGRATVEGEREGGNDIVGGGGWKRDSDTWAL